MEYKWNVRKIKAYYGGTKNLALSKMDVFVLSYGLLCMKIRWIQWNHSMESFHRVIPWSHSMESFHGVIPWSHSMESFHVVIPWSHSFEEFHGVILSKNSMWLTEILMDGICVKNGWNMGNKWIEYRWNMGGLWAEYGWNLDEIWVRNG